MTILLLRRPERHWKPRGQTTVLGLGGHGAVVLQPQLGDNKEDIEGHVATEFFFSRIGEKRPEPCFQWLGVDLAVQNDTTTVDFTVHRDGRLVGHVELVELVERPAGARGSPYTNVSTKYSVRQRAKHAYKEIEQKWANYKDTPEPIFLVLYCTEKAFMPGRASTQQVTHWLHTLPDAPCFAGIFLRSIIPGMPNQLLFTPNDRIAYLAWAAEHGVACEPPDEDEAPDEVAWNLKPTDFLPR